ncbi:hypothetical protein FACS189487_08730 [Campylobacterota bacterium]|nr:hypothetical protein FACS189487_08730 [Campylobacterota bacterium]
MLLLATLFSLTACSNDFHNYGKDNPPPSGGTPPPKYTVSFNGNGASADSTPAAINDIFSGATIEAPTADPEWDTTPTANVFEGWYNGSTEWIFGSSGGTPVTANITLTAKWKFTADEVAANAEDFPSVAASAITTVTEGTDFAAEDLQTYLNGLTTAGNYVVNLTGNHDITPVSYNGVTLQNGVNVSLRGSQTIALIDRGHLFRINSGAELSIRGPTLMGFSGNQMALIRVYGNLTLHEGSITGNENVSFAGGNYGGGVYVNWGGTFTMNGGTISGNQVTIGSNNGGGGVYVEGTFTMTAGTISGNTVDGGYPENGGGGVLVWSGTFTKTGGIIYGNDAVEPSNRNTVINWPGTGHAVNVRTGGSTYLYRDATAGPTDDILPTDVSGGVQGTGPWQ